MTMPPPAHSVRTHIWHEEPEADNPFATQTARCHGYDVAGDMLGRARWAEMLFLLFRGQAPSAPQAQLLDALALVLANPGPRDPAVHAAMCAGVGGSPAASALMAALAVGAGQCGGAREVFLAMRSWELCGTELAAWRQRLSEPLADDRPSIWPAAEHPAGFEPHAQHAATLVLQVLDGLADLAGPGPLAWLAMHRPALESLAGAPLAMTGIAAAALHGLGFTPDQGEMLHLLLRLPGAAAHTLEQQALGHREFPFFDLTLQDDPHQETADAAA